MGDGHHDSPDYWRNLFGSFYSYGSRGGRGFWGLYIALCLKKVKPLKQLKEALLGNRENHGYAFCHLWWEFSIFVRFLGLTGLPGEVAKIVGAFETHRLFSLLAILILYLILGCFMDGIGMMMLTLPIVFPAIIALGFDPIWFGIILVKMVEVCLITPRLG